MKTYHVPPSATPPGVGPASNVQRIGMRGSRPGLIRSFLGAMQRSLCAIAAMVVVGLMGARAEAEVLHTFGNSKGHEIVNVIAVDMTRLRPLVPAQYTPVPASAVLFGRPDQGVVVMANFQALNPFVDNTPGHRRTQVDIDVAILIAEPAAAASVGLNVPGTFHLYALRIFTDDPRYAESLRHGGIPVEFFEQIGYQRPMDDATGVGDLIVSLPERHPFLASANAGQGYAPVPNAANRAAFWVDGERGTAVLSFVDQPFRQGGAISRIYTRPNGSLNRLLEGGGLGPCPPDPNTGFPCILAPGLNFSYDQGTVGTLQLLKKRPGHTPGPHWARM